MAANLTVDEIGEYLNVDSLSYLSLAGLVSATGAVNAGFCDACLTGTYPIEIPVDLEKKVLEIEKVLEIDTPSNNDCVDLTETTLLDAEAGQMPAELAAGRPR